MKEELPDYSHLRLQGGMEAIKKTFSVGDKDIISKFLKYCSITAGKSKLHDYNKEIVQIADVMEKPLDELDLEDVRAFLGVVNQSPKANWTKRSLLGTLSRFLKWKYKDITLLEDIRLPKGFNEEKINASTLIQRDELEAMLRITEKLRFKTMLILLYEAGCRPQELRNLKWKDIKLEDNGLVRVTFFSGKTQKARSILLKESRIHLERWKAEYCYSDVKESDWIFPSPQDRKKPIRDVTLSLMVTRISKRAGIDRAITPLHFRHTRLTEIRKTMPESLAKKYGGHSASSRIGELVYTHLNTGDLDEVLLKNYDIKEPDKETKHKLEKELDDLKKKFAEQEKTLQQKIIMEVHRTLQLAGNFPKDKTKK